MMTTTMDTTSANPSNPAPPPAKQNKPLACTACRARKLGCNRVHPCHNCIRSGAECIFPARRRVQRPRKTKNTELLQRLSRLENIVGKAGIENLLAADRGKNADPTAPPRGSEVSEQRENPRTGRTPLHPHQSEGLVPSSLIRRVREFRLSSRSTAALAAEVKWTRDKMPWQAIPFP